MAKNPQGYSISQSEVVGSCRKVGLKISYSILFLGCILGVEAIPLRFHLFPKLWVEVKNKSHEVLSYLAIVL